MVFVVCILTGGLGCIIGALLTTNTLRKAFVFSVANNTDYLVDVEIDYYSKQFIIKKVSKPVKSRAKRTK